MVWNWKKTNWTHRILTQRHEDVGAAEEVLENWGRRTCNQLKAGELWIFYYCTAWKLRWGRWAKLFSGASVSVTDILKLGQQSVLNNLNHVQSTSVSVLIWNNQMLVLRPSMIDLRRDVLFCFHFAFLPHLFLGLFPSSFQPPLQLLMSKFSFLLCKNPRCCHKVYSGGGPLDGHALCSSVPRRRLKYLGATATWWIPEPVFVYNCLCCA